jgi:hypothetical protein
MPDEVIESYTKQRSANVGEARGIRGVVSQQSRRVIGGVGFDEGGDIFVANFRSVRGAGRISRYDSLGVARAVYDFPVEGFDFQNAIWSLDGTAIVTWSYLAGWVRRWIWEGRQ